MPKLPLRSEVPSASMRPVNVTIPAPSTTASMPNSGSEKAPQAALRLWRARFAAWKVDGRLPSGEPWCAPPSHLVRTVAITERPLLAKFASETAPIQMVFATARMQCRRKASFVAHGEVVRIGTGTRGHKSQDRLLRTKSRIGKPSRAFQTQPDLARGPDRTMVPLAQACLFVSESRWPQEGRLSAIS